MTAVFQIHKTKPRKKKGVEQKAKFYFVLKARNKEIVGRGQEYKTYAATEKGINALVTAARIASQELFVDKTEATSKKKKKAGTGNKKSKVKKGRAKKEVKGKQVPAKRGRPAAKLKKPEKANIVSFKEAKAIKRKPRKVKPVLTEDTAPEQSSASEVQDFSEQA